MVGASDDTLYGGEVLLDNGVNRTDMSQPFDLVTTRIFNEFTPLCDRAQEPRYHSRTYK